MTYQILSIFNKRHSELYSQTQDKVRNRLRFHGEALISSCVAIQASPAVNPPPDDTPMLNAIQQRGNGRWKIMDAHNTTKVVVDNDPTLLFDPFHFWRPVYAMLSIQLLQVLSEPSQKDMQPAASPG